MPPMDSVTHWGSPENRFWYSGVRANLTIRSFMMKWSTNSYLLLGEGTVLEVALSVDVDEGGGTADGHSGAVLLLDGSQVGEVHPLDGLLGVLGRLGDVEAVEVGHHLELAQGANLLLQLLAIADVLLGHDLGGGSLLGLLVLESR